LKKIIYGTVISLIAIAIIAGVVYSINPQYFDKPKRMLRTIAGAVYSKNPLYFEKTKRMLKRLTGRATIMDQESLYSYFRAEVNIRDFFQDRQGGFFVDVGCAWPIKASNTYYLEKHLQWTGIGIDALNDYAAEWKEKRPNSKFFNFLVTENSEGSGRFYKSEITGISSVDSTFADGSQFPNLKDRKVKVEEIQVPKISLNDLFDREGIKKIDLISIDIEGHELEALKGLDLERFSPELVVIESWDSGEKLTKHFNKHGYQLIQRYAPHDPLNLYFARNKQPAAAPGN